VISDRDECGLAINRTGIETLYGAHGEHAVQSLRALVGKTLFDCAEWGILSTDPLERSIGIACLSALSQKFLSCSKVRKRGYISHCWKTSEDFVKDFPPVTRIIHPEETVAVIGNGSQVVPLQNTCRKLQVISLVPKETFESIVIDEESVTLPAAIEYYTPDDSEKVLGAADIVLLNTATLVDNSFERYLHEAKNARLIGMFGLGSSLIPDAFFERGVGMFSSFRIIDPASFATAIKNDYDIECSMKIAQKEYLMMRQGSAFQAPDHGSHPAC
jgi:uncharacterized protein (DUF4213/DUF364 family)